MRVVAYIRVSTEEQADHGQSLDVQRAKVTAYAALYDLDLVEIIEDAGESGKTLHRDGLQHALALLERGEVQGLLVAKLDRLTRSVGDWQTLITDHFGEKAGKQLFSVADCVDTRTAAGRLVLNVLLSVAQWEREVISERTRDTLRYKISQSQRVGKIRFGFDLSANGKTLVPNALEQQALAVMRQLRQQGQSYRDIAAELNARGVATKGGKPWVHTTIKGLLARAA